MKILIVLAHPEHQSFNGAMFRTAVETLSAAGHEVRTSDLHAMQFNPVSGRHNFLSAKDPDYFKQQIEEMHASETYVFADDIEEEIQKLDVLKGFRERRIPIDNIVQDWQYWKPDSWGSHQFDPSRFPDPEGWVREIHDKWKARLMISVWGKFYPGTANYDALKAGGFLFEAGLKEGMIDWLGKPFTFLDAYSKEGRRLFWAQIERDLLSKGVDSWWMDATEPDWHSNLSVEERAYQMASPAAGLPGAAIFNTYPLVHALGMAEGLRAAQPDKRPFILTRSGFGGTQRASAAVWSGDVAARSRTSEVA